jgi:group I intron endonuclease
MEKKYGYIYKIVSPTGRIYVGKTTNLKLRFSDYRRLRCKAQKLLYHSLSKYSFSGHTTEIIYEGENTTSELNKLEIFYIGLLNTFHHSNENGLNLTLGGEGGLGIKISDEHRKKIIESNKRRVYKKHSEETKKLISETRKKTGKTEAHQKAMEKFRGRKVKKSKSWINKNAESIKKPILQFDLDNNLIREWKSAKDVELELSLCRKNISANLRNKTKHAYGYIWKFK